MDYSTPDFPVLHHLPELAQTHVHWVSDAINHLALCSPFSSCLQSFPASWSFLMSQLFASSGQNIGTSASASVLPMNIQDWFFFLDWLLWSPFKIPDSWEDSQEPSPAAAKSLQSCLTLCDPTDGSPPGFPVPGILQARTLEWVAISFPMHESEKWKWSRSVVSDPQRPYGLQTTRLLRPWDFPGKSTGVGCHCLLRKSLLHLSINNHYNLLRDHMKV